MSAQLDIVIATQAHCPDKKTLTTWAKQALQEKQIQGKIAIRIVDEKEMTELNGQYRNKPYPTNILSFPSNLPPSIHQGWLGDLVICAPVLALEAAQQNKALNAHWAHIVVHGILHLLGHDHEAESDAEIMEALEEKILHQLGFDNPYKVKHI